MTTKDDSGVSGCRPVLCVDDVPRSLAYYVDVLGFRLGLAWSDAEQRFLSPGEPLPATFAIIGLGDVQLMLAQQAQGAAGMWIHLDVDSAVQLDALQRRWSERGAHIVEPPVLRPWGMYEMRVRDPDGHVLRVSAPPHLSR